jgi:CheY-like chemotaxis protein
MAVENPIRILLVDDAPSVREALRWACEDESYLLVVGEADNGPQAITLAAQLRPDVVILDIELPALDGYAVARTLQTMTQPPVIIFLSVHSDPDSRQRAFAAGGASFVDKGRGWLPLIAQLRTLTKDK